MNKTNIWSLSKKGFSLVEIIVAMALLSLFVAVSIPLLSISFEGIMWGGDKSKLTYEAQTLLEDMEEYDEGTITIVFSDTIKIDEMHAKKFEIEVTREDGKLQTSFIYYRAVED